MNLSWLTLRDLEYLVAVAEHLHFGKAAESCHVTQPALSTQIKKIEDHLQVPLFERNNRNVRITPAGEGVIRQARIVLEEASKIPQSLQAHSAPLSGTFRLGVIASLGPYLIPYLLRPLRKNFPRLELLLTEGLTDTLIAELRAGGLDAVLASPTFDSKGLKSENLFFEPFYLAVPKGHPLATRTPLKTADLNPEEMILLQDGHCLKDQILDLCSPARRGKARKFHATSLETLRHMVASGLGYSLFPFLSVTEDARLRGLLEYRVFPGGSVGRSVALYCRDRFTGTADIRELKQQILKSLPQSFRIRSTSTRSP